MIRTLAIRSLMARPLRTLVVAVGFGLGVAVMAILLGVAAVVLREAQAPALAGGGDVVVRLGPNVPAAVLLSGTLESASLAGRVAVAAPFETADLYLIHDGHRTAVTARAGVPSLERALGDPETANIADWHDTSADRAWIHPSPDRALRALDRFHPVPDAPAWADSWAEWLYFNGRTDRARFYLTFMVGPHRPDGTRTAGVRLQFERDGRTTSYSAAAPITDAQAMRAPDLTIGPNTVRLDGLRYRIHLELADAGGRPAGGDLSIAASAGRLIPPIEIRGAHGWRSGYVVPVTSGTLDGTLQIGNEPVSLAGGTGYHDHNWGFWKGVSWQWGQVQYQDVSIVYGRVFPPADAADPDSLPGFVGVLGPDGPLGYSTNVTITETNDGGEHPRTIEVRAHGGSIDLQARIAVDSVVTTAGSPGPLRGRLDFLQMRGTYTVTGTAGGRTLDFTAPGSAETFRGE